MLREYNKIILTLMSKEKMMTWKIMKTKYPEEYNRLQELKRAMTSKQQHGLVAQLAEQEKLGDIAQLDRATDF